MTKLPSLLLALALVPGFAHAQTDPNGPPPPADDNQPAQPSAQPAQPNTAQPNVQPPAPPAAPPSRAQSQVQLTVSWDQSSVEVFPVYDPVNQRLVDTAEVMSVSWYATGGVMEQDRTTASGLSATNTWTAPQAGGTVFFWAVLHDSRGGLDTASMEVAVTP